MSVDHVTEELRAKLLSGARRRLRRERMRVWIGAAVAAIAVVAGLTTAVVRSHDSTRVTTVATPGDQAAFAVCDDYLSIKERLASLEPVERSDWDALGQQAAATDDATLSMLVAKLRGVTGSSLSPADFEVMIAIDEHCKDIGSPNYNPRYVPIELGPQPAVDLRTYGEPQLFDFGKPPLEGREAPVGRDLSPVQLGVTTQGGYVMHWTYTGHPPTRASCLAYGFLGGSRLKGCAGSGDALGPPFGTVDRMTTLSVPAGTLFATKGTPSSGLCNQPS